MPVYLDHAATTPLVGAARDAMLDHLDVVGNPSSLHAAGRVARRAVEESREQIAEAIAADPNEVVFCSGGTEGDNLAVKGMWWSRTAADPARRTIVASPIEHHAVLDSLHWLADTQGAGIAWLRVDDRGIVDAGHLEGILRERAAQIAFVTVMSANNETGAVQPVAELSAAARAYEIPVHTDAVQALGALPVDFGRLGVDAMTITSHKVGGPLGVGALVAKRNAELTPVLHGGGQERKIRSGTLDTPAIAGFAAAVAQAVSEQEANAQRLRVLRASLIEVVRRADPQARITGSSDQNDQLPGIVHVTFEGCDGDAILMLLDAAGIACSTGSACTAGVSETSHVLTAMGYDEAAARGAVRFSLGHTSTEQDVSAVAAVLPGVVERARSAGVTPTKAHSPAQPRVAVA